MHDARGAGTGREEAASRGRMTRQLDRRTTFAWLAGWLVLALAGCGGSGATHQPQGTPGPQPSTCAPAGTAGSPSPATGGCGGAVLTQGELRLFLIDELGPLWYCDRDSYPVGRDEQAAARDGYDVMVADTELFPAVAAKLGIDPNANPTDAQKLELYRLWKMVQAIQLEPIGNARFRFDYLAQPPAGAIEGTRTAGIVDARGEITVEQQAAAGEPMCPICLSSGTLIETPDGAIAVERLRIGDTVWTLDRAGQRVPGRVIALGSTPAPVDHHVIRLVLADGRTLSASPGHPLADGRTLADLRVGETLDGSRITALETIAYDGAETWDLAVSGETGIYLAGGIPLGSTLD